MKVLVVILLSILSLTTFGQDGKIVLQPRQEGKCKLVYGLTNIIYLEGLNANFDSLVLKCKYGVVKRDLPYKGVYGYDASPKDSITSEIFYLYKKEGDSLVLIDTVKSCISKLNKIKVGLYPDTNVIFGFDTLNHMPIPYVKLNVTCISVSSFNVIHYRGDSVINNFSIKLSGRHNKREQLDSAYNSIINSMENGDKLVYYNIWVMFSPSGLPFEVTIYRKED